MANNYRKTSKPRKKHRNTRRNTLGGSSKLLPHEQLKLDLEDIRRGTLRIDGSRPHELPWEKSKREKRDYNYSMGYKPGTTYVRNRSRSVVPYNESKHTTSKQHTVSKPHPNSKPHPKLMNRISSLFRKSHKSTVAPLNQNNKTQQKKK